VQYLTTSGILAVSSNTGTIKIGEMLSNDTLFGYLSKFGMESQPVQVYLASQGEFSVQSVIGQELPRQQWPLVRAMQ
jgi:cell division protein FtsI/penicillin-binding protein 2